MDLSRVLALVASVVFLARLLPQPVRSLRTGRIEGVSGLAAMNAAIADGAWGIYGLSAHLPVIWAVSLPAFGISVVTALAIRRGVTRRDLALAGSWAAVVAGATLAGPDALALTLTATVAVCCGPAVWSAYRSHRPAGVSTLTWRLAVADATSWGAYGIVVHSVALELYGVVMATTALAMLLRLRTTRALAVG